MSKDWKEEAIAQIAQAIMNNVDGNVVAQRIDGTYKTLPTPQKTGGYAAQAAYAEMKAREVFEWSLKETDPDGDVDPVQDLLSKIISASDPQLLNTITVDRDAEDTPQVPSEGYNHSQHRISDAINVDTVGTRKKADKILSELADLMESDVLTKESEVVQWLEKEFTQREAVYLLSIDFLERARNIIDERKNTK